MPFVALLMVAALAQQPPAPQPFPQPRTPAPQRPAGPPPATPLPNAVPAAAASCSATTAPTDAMLGVSIYPGAQFIAAHDAGRGQCYYLYGSTASFVAMVAYYRTVLKRSGDLVFDLPATHTFEVGRFRDETMAFPPGVTIKDYQTEVSAGYPNPKPGGTPARFPTLIQVVPVTER